ncbi:MAG: F0F1 ATP synthase subunit alpha [Candidatus Makaraimicrobium thalassicum]|nr:MAG: F0F1 ATP synthase subunit alpha [Candidatus Omnitrophota bacterium]
MKKKNPIPVEITEAGEITDIRRDVITIDGIPNCVYGELLDFASGDQGVVIEFDEKKVVALLMGSGIEVRTGDKVVSRGGLFKVPVTGKLTGRIVNGLVRPVDGKGPLGHSEYGPVFRDAPPITSRVPIDESLKTGIKIIDTMIPLGKGQRELIIGDRQTGKTVIAADTILNQKNEGVICIYCWVGGSYNAMVKLIELLANNGAMDYTVFVAAPASVSSTEQYLAPYTAATIGEYFMNSRKKDVLVIFDNLTRHAWIYRQISLLLNRSPGREAYPGDIFYIHSQLMERSCKMDPDLGGSMTFMPIADTLQGDVTGYIQTNLVSMTDGQIYTSAFLFNEGFRPAVDIGLSVSRIGSRVQSPALKEVSAKLRLEYAQFKELQKLTKLRTRVSEEIVRRVGRGQTLSDILVQGANSPVSEVEEILIFYAFEKGLLEQFGREWTVKFEKNILGFLGEYDPALLEELQTRKTLTDEVKAGLDAMLKEFFKQ